MAFIPPVFFAVKIRQVNTGKMVGVAKQRVTVVHAVLKLAACKMWHASEFINLPITDQPPRKRRL